MTTESESPYLTPKETAFFLRLQRRTLDNMRWLGYGPRFRKHGGRILYHRDDVTAWSDASAESRHLANVTEDQIRARRILMVIAAGLGFLAWQHAMAPKFYLNASPSAPRGVYVLSSETRYERGDLVVAALPPAAASLAALRGYLASGIPVLKRVSGLRGDSVCRDGLLIRLNGRIMATAKGTDARGRSLPVWNGCLRLGEDDVFLLGEHPDSFDGRYFGVLKRTQIIGKATRIW